MSTGLTPAQRLQASRHAISAHLQGQGSRRGSRSAQADGTPDNNDDAGARVPSSGPTWWRIARHTLTAWWHNHPAYSAALIAQPVLTRYVHERPLQVVGIAAAVGAAAVVLKPWRLISVGALVAATLKSQDITRLMMSLIAQAMPPEDRKDETS
jgi:hypothetical protein